MKNFTSQYSILNSFKFDHIYIFEMIIFYEKNISSPFFLSANYNFINKIY